MKSLKVLLAAGLSLWLAGCVASGPAPSQYTLPADAGRQPGGIAGADAEYRLVVTQPRLARFLDVDGLILQLDDITLNEANHHLWAAPIDLQLERGLRTRLAARLPHTRVMHDDADSRRRAPAVLRLEVDRFHGRFDGRAVVGGQWQLSDEGGELLAMAPFNVEVELAQDGYPALVRALGRGWDQVADEIAAEIKRLR
ncbi:MAG: ABC-type transport auxiliary lipoprotein family protein [Halomonas sp.]|uniref:PqiC family protein n=1 Tax=Halomonas sp. TaxID=1486246 RepID=UPI00287001CF|nr:ABC-type transport auxiliary lipoprotein family protein [Halomonas sp.]MDR9440978.1 ABC-type transport auxiliary lipoprotein family protein [Halomonas sp.]